MDEGLNTFLQYLTEQEWEEKYPSRRGEPQNIVQYMRSQNQVPIMTNSESLLQFGPNAYAKPATALNILRESILGRELFDFAFKEYAQRWKFKRPTPADFFRSMEDASGVDLDWFWRGWFYSTDHTDLSIESLKLYTMESPDPKIEKAAKKKDREDEPETLSKRRNKSLPTRAQSFPELKDFYNDFDKLDVTELDQKAYKKFLDKLEDDERELLEEMRNFYVVDLSNQGGLVMPVIFDIEFEDSSHEELRIPAEIWRRNNKNVSKLIVTEKTIKSLTLDPNLETADVDLENNHWPRKIIKSRFKLFKEKEKKNDMQKARGDEDESGDEEEDSQ